MNKKKLFNIFSTMILVWLPVLTTCSESTKSHINYDNLKTAIAEAESEFAITYGSGSGDSELGTYWVTPSVKADFKTAIETAKTALNSGSQTVVNKATRDLAVKIEDFKNVRKQGNAEPVDKTALSAKITEAEMEKLIVVVALSSGEVAQGRKYVSQSDMNTFETNITQAKNALTSSSQDMVNTILSSLNTEITVFRGAQHGGTKLSGFTQPDLNDLLESANKIKEKIKISNNNGDDISPAEYWVNQSDYSALDNAITAASNHTGNIDVVYNSLVSAINTINTNKKFGSTADKTSLFAAIRAADTAKNGVVVAVNAANAPCGYKWATQSQWSPFNAAYTNALNAARAPNATKNDVALRTSALVSATNTFKTAVTNNGPGTKLNTVTIEGLPNYYNGCQIDIYLFANSKISVGEHLCYGSGTIKNEATGEIKLNLKSGATWSGGSLYVVFVINKQPIQYYISKSTVRFIAALNVVTSFSEYKKYAFKYKFSDIADEMGVPSGGITLNDLYQYMEGLTYIQMIESGLLPGHLYKDEALTRPFNGGDWLYANTDIYCGFPLIGNRGVKIGTITGTITLTDVPAPAPLVFISVRSPSATNQWYSGKSWINLTSGSGTLMGINWSIPIYEKDNFFASNGSFTLYVRPVGDRNETQINIPGTKYISGASVNVGSLGTVSLNY